MVDTLAILYIIAGRYIEYFICIAGRYCTHEETAGSASVAEDCDSTLQNYLDTLSVSCEGDESEAAVLTWTPDENTPDVVYYQVRKRFCRIPNLIWTFAVIQWFPF